MRTVTVYTLTLYDECAGDWTEVHGSELRALRSLLDYVEDRCERYRHRIALLGSDTICACNLIRPDGGAIDPDGVRRLIEGWEHDCNGEGQGPLGRPGGSSRRS